MIEIECPTCESKIIIQKKLHVGDRIECKECGEILQILSTNPIEVDYWDSSEGEDSDLYAYYLSDDELSDIGLSKFTSKCDEENESFELPDSSSLFGDCDDESDTDEDNN